MTRIEAQENFAKAMSRLEATRAAVKLAGLDDLDLATRLHNEMLEALAASKDAAKLKTRFAPSI